MRTSHYFLPTLKETPADAELISHQLMLRAGMIRKLSAGLYTWLPLGLRVLRKVEAVVREEMNRIGGMELLMTAVQPKELWEETDRWGEFGAQLLKIQDRHQREFCFGPTHEEVITDVLRGEVRSYKQLPLTFYQIQTKFRDEIRPRFGVMRAREFLMKDAYSFHIDGDSLAKTYDDMYQAYTQIFTRLGLTFRAVIADTGSIGGNQSHEFQVLADSGEDLIAFSDQSDYAANIEKASALMPSEDRSAPTAPMSTVDTPGMYTIEALCQGLGLAIEQTIKTLIVQGEMPDQLVALLIRGDDELNVTKAEKLPQVASPLVFASDEKIRQVIGCDPGSIGPVGLNLPIIADWHVLAMSDFSCGINQNDKHYLNVNWARDLPLAPGADLRQVKAGDLSPDGKGRLQMMRGIEVGHIFQLGNKYSQAMKATVLNENGKSIALQMGCYGIGISRIVAAAIEQSHDDRGIIWSKALAPFAIVIVPLNYHKSYRVKETSDQIYQDLRDAGFEVLLEDRKERPGVLFANADLLGVPHRIVVTESKIDSGHVEYKARHEAEPHDISMDNIIALMQQKESEHV